MRKYMASVGLTLDEINQKVHELYITNTTTFPGERKAVASRKAAANRSGQ
jgi:hypothetical protein